MANALIPASGMTLTGLSALAVPAGLWLAPGGSRQQSLDFSVPPSIALDSRNPGEILEMLRYAGLRYQGDNSPAARLGVRVFEAGRALGESGPYSGVTFDWDHTLSDYQIFEDVAQLIRVRSSKTRPSARLAATPMVAVETARPFMQELAFGTMAGFALRQGLKNFSDWERYEPRVGVATHTWPDRLGVLAAHFMPLLPLMEGLLPGSPRMYEKFTDGTARSVIHLHHFLHYAEVMILLYNSQEFRHFTPVECDSVMGYLEDGKAHYRKPIGAWAMRGWDVSNLLHLDDSSTVVGDLLRQADIASTPNLRALHVPHPHSNVFRNVQEWHKISLPALWRRRDKAMLGVVRHLARLEWKGSSIQNLMGALGVFPDEEELPASRRLPEGTILTMHETPTTLGEFWDYYVEPTNRMKSMIRESRKLHGGLAAIRRAYRATLQKSDALGQH